MVIVPDKERILRALADHTLWYGSGGRAGCRADVCGCDLRELTADDMRGMTWRSAYRDAETIWPECLTEDP
jgi:hypothetical protein